MRKYLPLIALLAAGCYGPHVDLNFPICFVLQKPHEGWKVSDENTLIISLQEGTRMWTKHLTPKNFDPTIVYDESHCENPPIYVRFDNLVQKNICARAQAYIDHHTIRFDPSCNNAQTAAHELGHILWNFQPMHIHDGLSIMTPTANFYVTPDDMNILCENHPEITCHPMIWCKDDFYDEWRCPSANPEEGEAMRKAKQEVSSPDNQTSSFLID